MSGIYKNFKSNHDFRKKLSVKRFMNYVQLYGFVGKEQQYFFEDESVYALTTILTYDREQQYQLVMYGKKVKFAEKLKMGICIFVDGYICTNTWTHGKRNKQIGLSILVKNISVRDNFSKAVLQLTYIQTIKVFLKLFNLNFEVS